MILHVCTIFSDCSIQQLPFFSLYVCVCFFFFHSTCCLFVCLSFIWTQNIIITLEKCVYLVWPETNESKKETTETKAMGKAMKRERRANSNICCTANNDVATDQYIKDYSLAHDIRMFWMRCWCLFTNYIPHPCSYIYET